MQNEPHGNDAMEILALPNQLASQLHGLLMVMLSTPEPRPATSRHSRTVSVLVTLARARARRAG